MAIQDSILSAMALILMLLCVADFFQFLVSAFRAVAIEGGWLGGSTGEAVQSAYQHAWRLFQWFAAFSLVVWIL